MIRPAYSGPINIAKELMLHSIDSSLYRGTAKHRRWLRQHDYRCEGYPIESYACVEQLPGSFMPPPIDAANPLVKEAPHVVLTGSRAPELPAAKAEHGLMTTDGAVGVGQVCLSLNSLKHCCARQVAV